MQIIGIICEYNPFHNGHLYHINEIKKKYPHSLLILCLNGYFLQRGEVSLLTKEAKTKIALENNVDIVIELPVLYGCQSADTFAQKSIELLNALKVEKIIFGSETNDLSYLKDIAQKQQNLTKEALQKELKKGISYPKSLTNALNLTKIGSNDLLGISYCKTILNNHYNLKLETIQRTNDYLDTTLDTPIISAQNIRFKLKNNLNISSYLPQNSLNSLVTISYPTLFNYLKYHILVSDHLNEILDVTEGMDYKLKKEINNCENYEQLLNCLQSKRYSQNRLTRLLIHLFLGIKKEDVSCPLSYIKILGFNTQGQKYLNENRQNFLLPTKVDKNSFLYHLELKASLLYDLITSQQTYLFEKKNCPIYMKTAPVFKESNQK